MMQATYQNKQRCVNWDPVHLNYPVRKFPSTGLSSETIGRRWRNPQEISKSLRQPIEELKDYYRNYNVTSDLNKSQTTVDFGFKLSETKRFNKHTSCTQNDYIYPPSRKLEDRVPQSRAFGKTETQSLYVAPAIVSRLVTEKDQYKHPTSITQDSLPVKTSWKKDLEYLDTAHEGFEKYLDPYLSSSRLHYRPYTADQLQRISCSSDVITYYTFANVPWTRKEPPDMEQWRMPHRRPKSMYDREKFKEDFREVRTHNKILPVPGTFRSEFRDNYTHPTSKRESKIHNYEEDVRSYYKHMIADLPTNLEQESFTIERKYSSENFLYGSKKPVCAVFDPFVEKNRRLKK